MEGREGEGGEQKEGETRSITSRGLDDLVHHHRFRIGYNTCHEQLDFICQYCFGYY